MNNVEPYYIIKNKCKDKGITIKKMCNDLDINVKSFQTNAKRCNINAKNLAKIAKYLNIDIFLLINTEQK